MIKGFLFDLDGVILDSNPVIEAFWEGWAIKEGIPFDEQIIKEKIHGRTTWETINTLFEHCDQERRQAIYDDGVQYDLNMQPPLMPGVAEFIAALGQQGLPVALVTSSPGRRAAQFLELHGLHTSLVHRITAESVTRGKPDPEPYVKGAALLGLDAADCLVFEDSDSGIKAGLAAGARVIAINNLSSWDERVIHVKGFDVLNVHDIISQMQKKTR